jgi:hypothetical protein
MYAPARLHRRALKAATSSPAHCHVISRLQLPRQLVYSYDVASSHVVVENGQRRRSRFAQRAETFRRTGNDSLGYRLL